MKIQVLSLVLALFVFSCTAPEKEQRTEETSSANSSTTSSNNQSIMYPEINKYIEDVKKGFESIAEDRKTALKKVALYIQTKKQSLEPVNLVFICTHNSRRSHLSQVWASTAAYHYGIDSVNTFSGGTEATAFNPRAVQAIERAGFKVVNPGGENPVYQVMFAEGQSLECFSKKYDHEINPKENFVAVMTCSEADKNCPFIPGATLRIPITYEDPKIADNTDQERAKYDERCKQIATEMLYIMSQVKV
jgi:arsenate reductase